MAHTPEIGGGEMVDVIRDVTLTRGVITPLVARHATRTALRYAFQADFLPFADTKHLLADSTRLVLIGTYSPLKYTHTQGTIICNPNEQSRSRSFVSALKTLYRIAGGDFSDADHAGVMVDLDQTGRTLHQDQGNFRRSFIQLAGQRHVALVDPTVSNFRNAIATFTLNPGDVYSMRFRKDASTISHAVEYTGEPYCVGVYINHEVE